METWLRGRRWDLAVLVAMIGVFHPLFGGDVIWLRDLTRWVVPSRHALRAALADGELPRWDHLQGVGVPIPANPLHGIFYPPTLLSLLSPLAWWTNLYLLVHVAFGALGVAALARRLRVSTEGAAIAGLAWALSGPTLSEWTAGIRLPSLSWCPWITLGAWSLAAAPGLRTLPGFALPVGLALLAGEPFMVLFALIFAVTSLPAAEAWEAFAHDRRSVARGLAFGALGLALGALLAGASLAPVLGAVAGTQRATALADAESLAGSVPAARLLDALVPGGFSLASLLDNDPAAQRVTGTVPLLYWHYLGAPVLGLALIGLRWERRRLALLFAMLFALALAMGEHTPLYGLAQWVLPPLRRMRSPEKFLALVALGTALLAGAGFDELRAAPRRFARVGLLGAALAAVLAWSFASPAITRHMHAGAGRALLGLAALAAVAVSLRRAPRLAPWLALIAIALDLGHLAGTVPMWTPLAEARWASPVAGPVRALHAPPSPPRLYRAKALGLGQHHAHGLAGSRRRFANIPPNTNRLLGLGMVPAYDVAASPALDRLLELRRTDTLRLLSVDAALQPARDAAPAPGLRLVARMFDTIDVLAVQDTLPRVYPVGETRAEAQPAPDLRTLQPEVIRGASALVPVGASRLDGAPGRAGTCVVRAMRNGRIDADCTLHRAAHVVVVEQFAPGWTATLDGRPTPIVRTNALVMGVRAPTGTHRLALRYDPPGLRLGLALSAVGAAIVTALVVNARRRAAAPA